MYNTTSCDPTTEHKPSTTSTGGAGYWMPAPTPCPRHCPCDRCPCCGRPYTQPYIPIWTPPVQEPWYPPYAIFW